MQETEPFISIVTLNWNQADVTCQFLESARKLNYNNYEILVCDMNSDVDPGEHILNQNFPKTRMLRSDKNLGFSGGNNWGIRQAKGDYFFIVNNDTEVTPTLLSDLLDGFNADPQIGVVCPKIRFFYQPNIIQYAGFNPINIFTGRTSALGSREEDRGQYDTPGYTEGAHGCAMMVKREVVEKVGMFPENFFLYYEEWDWSSRIIKAGYKIYYQAAALIYHKESLSVGKQNPLKVYYLTRNRILYMRRNTSLPAFTVFILFFCLFSVPKSVFIYLVRGQFKYLRSFLSGIAWNLTSTKHSIVY